MPAPSLGEPPIDMFSKINASNIASQSNDVEFEEEQEDADSAKKS